MEQNKRKYIVKQPQKSPTLSVQKANLIKAKLGLSVSSSSSSSRSAQSTTSGSSSARSLRDQADSSAPAGVFASSEPTAALAMEEPKNLLGSQSGSNANALNSIPKTDFECTDKKGRFIAGLFADHKTGCQVWHLCSNNRKYSFLCPTGTIFNAKLRICDWRYNVKCDNTPAF